MTEGVVDLLEVVQVEQQQRGGAAVAPRPVEGGLEPVQQQGFTVTQRDGAVTIARVRCPTAPKFWRWRDFPFPKIVPREISLPEDETELNAWKAQAVAAALCGVLGLAGYFVPEPAWAMGLFLGSYLAGAWFAAREALERADAKPESVLGIAATSMRHSTIVLDEKGDALFAVPNRDSRAVVEGFQLDGFWTALWASLFMSVLSVVLGAFLLGGTPEFTIQTSPAPGQVWL